ncbi:MAG: hypothetical protein NC299_11975 [Lachnospiraceae bacterium]|nr:hypothetical protein [Lachnospiraceae bacterium]
MAIENYATTPRVDLSTAGVKVAYAFETTKGTRPTSGWTHIPGIKSIPSMNEQPNMIDTTTLDETVSRVGVPGLKGLPSATNFTASWTDELINQWSNDVMKKYETAKDSGKQMWITVVVPGITDAFYFSAIPSALDLPSVGVEAAAEIDIYITPTSERIMAAKPTSIAAYTPSTSGS